MARPRIAAYFFTFIVFFATSITSLSRAADGATTGLPPIRHVFVIMLENQGYAATFGDPAADPYLATALPAQGALLTQYYGTGHFSNDNYVSFVSGQPPNPSNQADCPIFTDFSPATISAGGIAQGTGCVYPRSVQNIGTQLTAKGLTWKGYMEDMGNNPVLATAACGHPVIGTPDQSQDAVPGDGYATRHNPFVYFHSVIDNRAYCDAHVVALGTPSGSMPKGALPHETGLAHDLRSASTTPNFSFITPNLCNDGHDFPCTNQRGGASVGANIDAFLSQWVPKITSSPAFKKDGLLEITFDEAESPTLDATACCNEQPGPASPNPGISGPGGGLVGAVLISPYIRPGTTSTVAYNHYSSLATFEAIFGLRRLGYAATAPANFGADVFTNATR